MVGWCVVLWCCDGLLCVRVVSGCGVVVCGGVSGVMVCPPGGPLVGAHAMRVSTVLVVPASVPLGPAWLLSLVSFPPSVVYLLGHLLLDNYTSRSVGWCGWIGRLHYLHGCRGGGILGDFGFQGVR